MTPLFETLLTYAYGKEKVIPTHGLMNLLFDICIYYIHKLYEFPRVSEYIISNPTAAYIHAYFGIFASSECNQ